MGSSGTRLPAPSIYPVRLKTTAAKIDISTFSEIAVHRTQKPFSEARRGVWRIAQRV